MSAGNLGPLRVVMIRDGHKFYYAAEMEHKRNGIAGTVPFFSADVSEAKRFTPTEAVARRDAFRAMSAKERFYVEAINGEGDPLFEDRVAETTPTDSTDPRSPMWVIPDDLEQFNDGRGFLVVPAYTSTLGRCWAVRSCDVPSLNEEQPSALETIYDRDPEMALRRARLLWGDQMQPWIHPEIKARAEAQRKQAANEIQQSQPSGRQRPGNR